MVVTNYQSKVLKTRLAILGITFFICHFTAAGQELNFHDTIIIPEVLIRKTPENTKPGFSVRTADSIAMLTADVINIGDLLSTNFPVYIKAYGPGGISTASLRGASPSQTVVSWNGININNPMLGQSDLSVIEAGLSDEISVSSGSAPLSLYAGAIGGTINLLNKPEWNNRTSFTAVSSAGSYGRLSSAFRLRTGTTDFQSVTRASISYARNDFSFRDPLSAEPVIKLKRENSQMGNKAFLQELYVRKNYSTLAARIWYQTGNRNIPAPVIVPQNASEKQEDEALRLMLDLSHKRNNEEISVKTALSSSRLDYTNADLSIFSENISHSWFLNASYKLKARENTSLEFILDNELTKVKSNNYSNSPLHYISSLALITTRKFGEDFNGTFMVKEILDRQKLLSPGFSLKMEFHPFNNANYSLISGISRNIRIPTMNELYWMPGGNDGLISESAMMYEAGARMLIRLSENTLLRPSAVIYANHIRDMIQWTPSEFSYWSATNAGKVNIRGIETDINLSTGHGDLKLELSGTLSVKRAFKNDATKESAGMKQLVYIPVNQSNSSFTLYFGKLFTRLQFIYTGKRYLTIDNTDYLQPFTLFNIMAGFKQTKNSNSLSMNIHIENLLNTDYQYVKWYPQPGTAWMLSLKYDFNNENNDL